MTTYFTSDVHYNHAKIIEYSKRKFSDISEMNEHVINSWKRIKENDTLWSLGDFAFGKIEIIFDLLKRANTKRFDFRMVLGNHDQEIIKNKELLLQSGYVKEIVNYKEIKVNDQFICLFHYPMRQWNKCHYGSWQLFGHVHGSVKPHGKSVDVGMDSRWITGKAEYRPFTFQELEQFMSKQKIVEHHNRD